MRKGRIYDFVQCKIGIGGQEVTSVMGLGQCGKCQIVVVVVSRVDLERVLHFSE